MTKPSAPSVVPTTTPALIDQRDAADMPCVERRGARHYRKLTLGEIDGRVALWIAIAGPVTTDETWTITAEIAAMRECLKIEQRRQDVEDDRAAEVESLAAMDREDLAGVLRSAEEAEDGITVALALEAIERQDALRDDARISAAEYAKAVA